MLREIMIEMGNEEIEVTINGKSQKVAKKVAALLGLFNIALSGTPIEEYRAIRLLK